MSRTGVTDERRKAWIEFLSAPSVQHTLNVRLDVTLKQRRETELNTERPLDTDVTVNVRQRRFSLHDAPLYAPFYCLTDDETRRIAVRLMNRLNKRIFGNAARRTHYPQRLTALICHHDRGTRRHLHAIFALPPHMPISDFAIALRKACRTEPFVYRDQRIEQVQDLARSLLYNANDRKTILNNSILYIHAQQTPLTMSGDTAHDPITTT